MPSSLKYTLRSLRRRPALAFVAAITIALALAGNATILSVVDAVLLEPLPFREPDRLVTLDVKSTQGFYISTSVPNLRDWRDRSRSFDGYAAAAPWNLTLTGMGAPEVLEARAVLGDLFGVLGLEAIRGRVLAAAETEPASAQRVVVLGHGFWQQRFGGDPSLVGRTLTLGGVPYDVVGILGPGTGWPSSQIDLYVPMGVFADLPWEDRDSSFGTRVVARLRKGVSVDATQRDLARVTAEIEAEVGEPIAHPEVRSLHAFFLGDLRPRAMILLGAVLFVLTIAVANVANLLLARAEARRGEILLRQALGARRSVVLRELVIESLLLCLAGGLVGLGLAAALQRVLRPILAEGLPALAAERLAIDGSVVALTLGLATCAGVLAGALPALRGTGHSLSADLRESGRGLVGGRSRLRSALVVGQLALALVVTVGAALALQSLWALAHTDKGFDAEDVLSARVPFPDGFPERDGWLGYYGALEERAAAIPGVRSAALSLLVPLAGRSWELRVTPEGRSLDDEGESVLYGVVSERYFETLGVPLLRGRAFDRGDHNESPPVVIIDVTMAERFWPGEDPLGKRISLAEGTPEEPVWRAVVGVAPNLRHYELAEPSRVQAYVPVRQSLERWGMGLSVLLRASVPPETLVPPLQEALAAIAPEVPLHQARPLQGYVDDGLGPTRSLAGLLASFCALSLLLSGVGIFAVMTYLVVRRTREIGIRIALGADRGRVLRQVTWEGVRLALLGVIVGLGISATLSQQLSGFLHEVEPVAPAVFAVSTGSLLVVALLAVLLPALRAASMNPVRALGADG
ncbi:MAG TPA: ABC transporter permease [Thermoanaerobaculia bacterium]|nr:ABC transporter permease [Thermoanaerobaculia bacterium]